MSTINQNLPLFKNMQQQLVSDTSNYENIKPNQKMPLSRIDVQTSKYSLIYEITSNYIQFIMYRIMQKLI